MRDINFRSYSGESHFPWGRRGENREGAVAWYLRNPGGEGRGYPRGPGKLGPGHCPGVPELGALMFPGGAISASQALTAAIRCLARGEEVKRLPGRSGGYAFPWSPVRWFCPPAGRTDQQEFHHAKNMGCFASKLGIYDMMFKSEEPYLAWRSKREGNAHRE